MKTLIRIVHFHGPSWALLVLFVVGCSDSSTNPPDPPVASDVSAMTGQEEAVVVALQATNPGSGTLTYHYDQPNDGEVSGTGPEVTYTPDPGFHGEDTFDFWVNDGSTDSGTATAMVTVEFAAVEAEFSPCGATGALGPSQDDCNDAYTGTPLEGEVSVTDGIQTWTVPVSGTYRITMEGAQGASGDTDYVGGRGARIGGNFALTAGDVLQLAVGQSGVGQGSDASGGGGGGSFVVNDADEPLIVAGGGGGTRTAVEQDGCDAVVGPFGVQGSGFQTTSLCSVKTTDEGLGGVVSWPSYGSAGAGFLGDGEGDDGAAGGSGGKSWANGMIGGEVSGGCGAPAPGGFGGGGSGQGCDGGGGGGGYSGGDGGFLAGGGGSYNDGSSPTGTAGESEGDGSIHIEQLP